MPGREDYEKFFKDADADGSGCLVFPELLKMLKGKGYKGSDSDLKRYFAECDTSGDGKITMDEYLKAMGLIPETDHKKAAYRAVFCSFDKDGSGKIDRTELKAVFKEMGRQFSDDELKRMIELGDKDSDGTLDYDEFIEQCFGKQ